MKESEIKQGWQEGIYINLFVLYDFYLFIVWLLSPVVIS